MGTSMGKIIDDLTNWAQVESLIFGVFSARDLAWDADYLCVQDPIRRERRLGLGKQTLTWDEHNIQD